MSAGLVALLVHESGSPEVLTHHDWCATAIKRTLHADQLRLAAVRITRGEGELIVAADSESRAAVNSAVPALNPTTQHWRGPVLVLATLRGHPVGLDDEDMLALATTLAVHQFTPTA